MDKSLIINNIMKLYNFRKYNEFAEFLNISSSLLSNWVKRNTYDSELLYQKCDKISAEYILTGTGEMLRGAVAKTEIAPDTKEVLELLRFKNDTLQEKLDQCTAAKKILEDCKCGDVRKLG